jgi:tRNA pseudouridine13 synthase
MRVMAAMPEAVAWPTPPLPAGDPTCGLPFAFGGPALRGLLRSRPEDFCVEEDLGWQPAGAGEHVFLTIRKRGLNTVDVARRIARLAGVPALAVGFAGLKDRHALTTQSFSVQLPGTAMPGWALLEDDGIALLAVTRHARKLRRGALTGNRFRLCVRGLAGDPARAEAILQRIAREGVPNAFGSQRFGRAGSNLGAADALLSGRGRRPPREQQGLYLSAARSFLFNQVLAARVLGESWATGLDGDVLMLEGTHSQFRREASDAGLAARLAALDLHPTGPLPGRAARALAAEGEAAALEAAVLEPWSHWSAALARLGVDAERRPLRVVVRGLEWAFRDDVLTLAFSLGAGAYATAVLREVVRAEPVD